MDANPSADESSALAVEHTNRVNELRMIGKIANHWQYQQVADLRITFGAGLAYFDKLYDERIAAANKLHKDLLADKKNLKAPAQEGWDYSGRLLAAWDTEQDIKRQAEQRRLEREAEEERQRNAQVAREAGEKLLAQRI